jgi:2,5-diketo-D-gluconate reductase B
MTVRGAEVPKLGFGTWQLRGDGCREAVVHVLDLGCRHVDTAQMYENEDAVGKAIAASSVDRDDIFLTTKVAQDSLQPKAVHRTTEASLRRLGTDYVDLLLIHWPNESVPLEQTLDAMLELQEAGKTRHVGVSNFPPSLLHQALGHAPVFCNQVEYHPFLGQQALLEIAREHDLMLTAYSPIAKGKVLGDPTIEEIAEAHGKTATQVTLRWLIQQPQVAAIPRSSDPDHREANFDIWDFELSDEEMDRLFDLDQNNRLIDPVSAPDWER